MDLLYLEVFVCIFGGALFDRRKYKHQQERETAVNSRMQQKSEAGNELGHCGYMVCVLTTRKPGHPGSQWILQQSKYSTPVQFILAATSDYFH